MSTALSFSIYLLKQGYDASNSLKNENNLNEIFDADEIPDGASLFILDNQAKPPKWKAYWGIKENIVQVLKGAIVFLPAGNRWFAITFGHVAHNLQEMSYEYDFGLRVTLNAIDPEELKNVDTLAPINARRQRVQLPMGSDLTHFDFESDSHILKSLTGKVKPQYKTLFKHVTGSSSLRITSTVKAKEISGLCEQLLTLYNEDTYLTAFPDIHNITPVKDPEKIADLNEKLIYSLREKDRNLVLTIPELLDYTQELWITYSGMGPGLLHADVNITQYYEYIESQGLETSKLDIDKIKKNNLVLTNADGQGVVGKASIFKCLLFDISIEEETYYLCEGNWYLLNRQYLEKLTVYLDSFLKDTTLEAYNHKNEADFNRYCADISAKRICLDAMNIAPTGQSPVEPCDIIEFTDNRVIMHHVKQSTRSSMLSHLFNQGLNSIQLIREEPVAVEKLKALISQKVPVERSSAFISTINNNKFKIIFQIISHKDKEQKSKNLPLFSRISLRRTLRDLCRMEVETEFCFVSNEQHTKTKQRKRHQATIEKKGHS